MKEKEKKKQSGFDRVLTVIGIVLCVILVPILIVNCTMIVKSYTKKDEVPSFLSISPMIVLTDSMYPGIKSGDLIVVSKVDAETLAAGDVISFFDPAGNGTAVVTHRIVEILNDGGSLSFRTKGDNNNTEDKDPVPAKNLVGIYKFRIPGAGNVAMFMQTTPGLIVCVALPIILLVGYDMLRRKKYDKAKADDTAALLAELERLRAAQGSGTQSSGTQDAGENAPMDGGAGNGETK